jgi:hypothetical protein
MNTYSLYDLNNTAPEFSMKVNSKKTKAMAHRDGTN